MTMRLAKFNNKSVVVVVRSTTDQRVLRGQASYEQRIDLGWVLSIALEDPARRHGQPVLILPESSWAGESFSCDYCIYLNQDDLLSGDQPG